MTVVFVHVELNLAGFGHFRSGRVNPEMSVRILLLRYHQLSQVNIQLLQSGQPVVLSFDFAFFKLEFHSFSFVLLLDLLLMALLFEFLGVPVLGQLELTLAVSTLLLLLQLKVEMILALKLGVGFQTKPGKISSLIL